MLQPAEWARKDPMLRCEVALSPTGGEDCFTDLLSTRGQQAGLPAVPWHVVGARLSAVRGIPGAAAGPHRTPGFPQRLLVRVSGQALAPGLGLPTEDR